MKRVLVVVLIAAHSLYADSQSPEWVSHLQGSYDVSGSSICRDGDNNIYLTGRMSSGSINGEPFTTGDAYDIYLAKFNSTGNLVWTSLVGGDHPDPFSGGESGYSVVYDSLSNSIYLGGAYSSSNGTASFGTIQIGGAGGFLLSMTPTANVFGCAPRLTVVQEVFRLMKRVLFMFFHWIITRYILYNTLEVLLYQMAQA